MCRSLAAGGRRCKSSHPALRAAKRASAGIAQGVEAAGPEHPATAAYLQAKAWEQKTKQAVEDGDDDTAAQCAQHAKTCAKAGRAMLAGKNHSGYPNADDPRHAFALGSQPNDEPTVDRPPAQLDPPAHVRSAAALAQATGQGTSATFHPRQDGGQTVAWSGEGFAGSATVYPDIEDGHPRARLAFADLDQDRYEALAASPWPYRTEGGSVIYDRVPADQAEQIIEAARTGRPGRPWERHGLEGRSVRGTLPETQAKDLVPESEAWSQNLAEDEADWVKRYTGTDYSPINKHLYEGGSLDDHLSGHEVPMRQVTASLDSALAKAATPGQPHRTYRGFKPPEEVRRTNQVVPWVRSNFQVGQTYRDDSYVSVSHCPQVAARFSSSYWADDDGNEGNADHRVVFEVVTSRGAAVANVSLFNNHERERLLPRGSTFRVVGIHENTDVAGHNAVLVQLVDVNDIPRH